MDIFDEDLEELDESEEEEEKKMILVPLDVHTLANAIRHIQKKKEQRLDPGLSNEIIDRFSRWALSKPEVPEGKWCADFGAFTLAGEGNTAKTILPPPGTCEGYHIDLTEY